MVCRPGRDPHTRPGHGCCWAARPVLQRLRGTVLRGSAPLCQGRLGLGLLPWLQEQVLVSLLGHGGPLRTAGLPADKPRTRGPCRLCCSPHTGRLSSSLSFYLGVGVSWFAELSSMHRGMCRTLTLAWGRSGVRQACVPALSERPPWGGREL